MLTLRQNRKTENCKAKDRQRGVALVAALLTLVLVAAIIAGMMIMSTTETSISANFRDEQAAFFASKAGIEEVRDRFRTGAPNSVKANLPAALPGQPNSVFYVINPLNAEVVAPWNGGNTTTYPDDEICNEGTTIACVNNAQTGQLLPSGNGWYTQANASNGYKPTNGPVLPWKWVRVTVKTNKSAAGTAHTASVDGAATGNRVCWNGVNEYTTANPDCGTDTQVYALTGLAVTPTGSRRMVQYEETLNINIPIKAALYTKLATDTGQALNITGVTDPACAAPPTYGAVSGTAAVTTPGGGNVTGCPPSAPGCGGTKNNFGWSMNLAGLINSLSSTSTSITTVPGITHDNANPPNYTLTNGNLGTMPTVTRDGSQAITSITNPGTPVTYITPVIGNLTLGGGSGGINGQGVLLVQGNLTIDVGKGFNYYGLIVVTGNITMISSTNSSVMPNIDGAIIGGGTFSAPISNFGGSISLHQDFCAVQSAMNGAFYRTLSVRELMR